MLELGVWHNNRNCVCSIRMILIDLNAIVSDGKHKRT